MVRLNKRVFKLTDNLYRCFRTHWTGWDNNVVKGRIVQTVPDEVVVGVVCYADSFQVVVFADKVEHPLSTDILLIHIKVATEKE